MIHDLTTADIYNSATIYDEHTPLHMNHKFLDRKIPARLLLYLKWTCWRGAVGLLGEDCIKVGPTSGHRWQKGSCRKKKTKERKEMDGIILFYFYSFCCTEDRLKILRLQAGEGISKEYFCHLELMVNAPASFLQFSLNCSSTAVICWMVATC